MTPFLPADWLPVIFAVLMGISILLYVVLDGFDLGVGILSITANDAHKDVMIASIGPFWDANETWLVLGIGLLLVAFPIAHGVILTQLYLPVAFMLIGLIFRGVAFEFRVKAPARQKPMWNSLFFAGSLITTLTQGYMLGSYIMAFEHSPEAYAFSLLTAVCLTAGYALMGATWLIFKTADALQKLAVKWALWSLALTAVGMAQVSIVTPLVSERIFEKWFTMPNLLFLSPIPLLTAGLFAWLLIELRRQPQADDKRSWVPFAGASSLFLLGFIGLGYSFFPFVVPEKITIWQAASSAEALSLILIGTIFVLPIILFYSVFAHWVFRGKAMALRYE
jgi:cytochrome bd ubiquinol oxidase subunit II